MQPKLDANTNILSFLTHDFIPKFEGGQKHPTSIKQTKQTIQIVQYDPKCEYLHNCDR
jgi:hypothetical protein